MDDCQFRAMPNGDACRRHFERFTLTAKGWAVTRNADIHKALLSAGFTEEQARALATSNANTVFLVPVGVS